MTLIHQTKAITNFVKPSVFTNKTDLVGKLAVVISREYSRNFFGENLEYELRGDAHVILPGEVVLIKKCFSEVEINQKISNRPEHHLNNPFLLRGRSSFFCLVLSSTSNYIINDTALRVVLARGSLQNKKFFITGDFRHPENIYRKTIELEGGQITQNIEESSYLLLGRPSRGLKTRQVAYDKNHGLPIHPVAAAKKKAREFDVEVIDERQFYRLL